MKTTTVFAELLPNPVRRERKKLTPEEKAARQKKVSTQHHALRRVISRRVREVCTVVFINFQRQETMARKAKEAEEKEIRRAQERKERKYADDTLHVLQVSQPFRLSSADTSPRTACALFWVSASAHAMWSHAQCSVLTLVLNK